MISEISSSGASSNPECVRLQNSSNCGFSTELMVRTGMRPVCTLAISPWPAMRPSGERLWDSITCAVVAQAGGERASPAPEWIAGVRLMLSEPELQGEFLKAGVAAERECAAAIAERTGTDPGRDMYPWLVAAAVGAAIRVANEQWLRAEPPVPLAPLLRDALTQIAAGLPSPATA